MQVQCLFLEEAFFTGLTYVIELVHVLLHVIMHGILTGHGNIAMRADKLALVVLEISERHESAVCSWMRWRRVSIFVGLSCPDALVP